MSRTHTISAHIDRWEKSSTEISVTGWAYSSTGNCEIRVLDGNQREIPAIVRRSRRIDIDRLFSIAKRQDTGFHLYVQRGEVTGRKMYVIFADANEQQLFQINLLKEQSAAVRTLPFADWFKPATWAKGFRYVFNNGGLKALRRDQQAPSEQVQYDAWFKKQRVTEEQLTAQREAAAVFTNRPKISIAIPLFNTNLKYLDVLLDSIEGQSYENWELCLADGSTESAVEMHLKARYQPDFSKDSRIRYQRLKENAGIAGNTNAALEMASGDYIMLSDHDDVIEKDALYEIVKLLNADPTLDIVYTDEDLTDEAGEHFRSPRFKPDFNIDLLRSINYICHLFCIRTSLMHEVGGFRSDCDGAQDWDLFLRCSEHTKKIGHVPKILYHWRESEASTARNPESKTYAIESARKALEGHYRRCGLNAELNYTDIFIMYQAKLLVHDNPKVSILIPNKDNRDVLKTCIDSILEKSTYRNLEILVIENNSTEDETFRYYAELTDEKNAEVQSAGQKVEEAADMQSESGSERTAEKAVSDTAPSDLTEPEIRVLHYKDKFNYAKINNFGAQYATGDYLLLLNNDTEVITPDWIEQMLGYCQREDVGAAGAKLLYPDETVQHCGVVVGVGGFAGHVLTGKLREDAGYMGRLRAIYDVSAVTGACLMIKRSIFEQIGGLDENLTVALNDIDLCLKVRETGALIVQNPAAELFHYESKSRGYEETSEKHERFKKEIKYFRDKWKDVLDAGDPYYNPNLSLMYGDCRLREEDEHFDIVDEIEGG